jgi:hypothetical protein
MAPENVAVLSLPNISATLWESRYPQPHHCQRAPCLVGDVSAHPLVHNHLIVIEWREFLRIQFHTSVDWKTFPQWILGRTARAIG